MKKSSVTHGSRRLLLCCSLVCALLAANKSRADLWYEIAVDTATINSDQTLTENGVTYSTAKNGQWNAPSTFSTGAYSGKSLKLSLPTTTTQVASDGKTTDRFEYELVQDTDPLAPTFWYNGYAGPTVYVGFAFKIISSQSQTPTNGGVILWQSWQGTPYAPPIRMDIKAPGTPGNPWPNRLFVQNDDTGPYTTNTATLVYNGTIQLDTWYTYVIEITPDYYDDNGYICLWVNGTQVATYTGKVGYTPQSQGGLSGILDSMMVKFGLYRNRPNPNLTFGFDNIGYGSTYDDVAP